MQRMELKEFCSCQECSLLIITVLIVLNMFTKFLYLETLIKMINHGQQSIQ